MVLATLFAAVAIGSNIGISDLQPIAVHDGVNTVRRLGSDGRNGLIISGVHNASPSADGTSRDYLVLLTGRDGEEIVDARPIPSLVSDARFGGELLSAAPHTGEDWKRVIRFAKGRVNGAPATLMILAERDMRKASTAYTAEPVQITFFELQRDALFNTDSFAPLGSQWSKRCYVDANLALKDELELPLPPDYAGPGASEPCGSGPSD